MQMSPLGMMRQVAPLHECDPSRPEPGRRGGGVVWCCATGRGNAWDLFGNVWDCLGIVWDLLGNVWDILESVWDI